jgi:hypothetical protein
MMTFFLTISIIISNCCNFYTCSQNKKEKKDFLITLENQIFFVDSFLSGSFRAKFWTFFLFQHFYSKAKIIFFQNWQKLQFLKKIQFPFSVNEGYNRTTRKVSRTTVDIGSQSNSDFHFVQKHVFLVHIPCQIADQ